VRPIPTEELTKSTEARLTARTRDPTLREVGCLAQLGWAGTSDDAAITAPRATSAGLGVEAQPASNWALNTAIVTIRPEIGLPYQRLCPER
jgi:hypothetical protein